MENTFLNAYNKKFSDKEEQPKTTTQKDTGNVFLNGYNQKFPGQPTLSPTQQPNQQPVVQQQPIQTPTQPEPQQNIFQKIATKVSQTVDSIRGITPEKVVTSVKNFDVVKTYSDYLNKNLTKHIDEDQRVLEQELLKSKQDQNKVAKLQNSINELNNARNLPANFKSIGTKYLTGAGSKREFSRDARGAIATLTNLTASTLDQVTRQSEGVPLMKNLEEKARKLEATNPEEAKKIRQAIYDSSVTRKLSNRMKVWARDVAPKNPDDMEKLKDGVVSTVPFLVASILSGGGATAMSLKMAALEAAGESGAVYEENRSKGMSIKEASAKADKNFLVNMVIGYFTDKVSFFSDETNLIKKAFNSMSSEAVQESTQQLNSNYFTGNPDIMEGVLESGKIGGASGGFLSIFLGGMGGGMVIDTTNGERVTSPTPEDKTTDVVKEALNKRISERTVKFREDSKGLTQVIPTNKIIINNDEDFQIAAEDTSVGKDAMSTLPPLAKKVPGGWEIINGNHRLAKEMRNGATEIEVMTDEVAYRKLADAEETFNNQSKPTPQGLGDRNNVDRSIRNPKGQYAGSKPATKYRIKEDLGKAGITITEPQESEIIDLNKKFFGDADVKITEQILANNKALGSYSDSLIKILKGQANPKDTFYHEAVHKYIDVFLTMDEQVDLFTAGMKKYGTEDLDAVEERISEDFISYAKSREGVVGNIKAAFDKLISRIESYIGNKKTIDAFYADLVTPNKETKAEKVTPKKVTKVERVLPKTTTVPRAQLPVGTGEKTASRLEARIKGALKDISQENIDALGLSTYNKMNENEQIKEASNYVTENPEEALKVLKGDIEPPKGLLRNSVYVAMVQNSEGKLDLQTKLATLAATRYGQEIDILKKLDQDSTVRWLTEAVKIKEDAVQKKFKKTVLEKVSEDSKSIEKTIKKADKYDWQKFIDEIKC
jgi:hypothetical protein